MPILKIILGGVLIFLATELGKRSGKLGGLVLSLPITSIITFLWLWFETKNAATVSAVCKDTFVFILPSLVFFLVLPLCLQKSIQFYFSFCIAIASTLVAYFVFYKFRGEI